MPYTDLGRLKEYRRAYYLKNREKAKAASRARYRADRKAALECSRRYRVNNREKTRDYAREWRKNNVGYQLEYQRAYRAENPKKIREYRNRYQRNRMETDPWFRVRRNLGGRIREAVKGLSKSASTLTLLGCPREKLMQHLESQFKPGMTWANYGPVWHVDHIKPCAKFDLTDPAQQRACFHWTNLQPLSAKDNQKKNSHSAHAFRKNRPTS